MKEKAKEAVQEGKSVVIFFEERYHSYLAPGHDPYQIRKEIDSFLNPPTEGNDSSKGDIKDETKNTPARDASGRFVSKSKATDDKKEDALEEDSIQKPEPPKKKSFWDSLR